MRCPGVDLAGPQDHGGNRRETAERYGLERLLDFSASINPLGHPAGLREHLAARWEEVLHYPDRRCAGLVAAIAQHYGLPETAIVAGNGSAELIDLLLRTARPRRLILCPPDFGLYWELAPAGTALREVPRVASAGFALDHEALTAVVAEGDLVLVSNPANPSGWAASPEQLQQLADRCDRVGALLAVDEAFADFCPDVSLLPRVQAWPRLVLLRSLTKFYGIPGLRLGFLVAAAERGRQIAHAQVPWSVNALAQAAGVYCLQDGEWAQASVRTVEGLRRELQQGLHRIPGLRALDSRANYLLVALAPPAPDAGRLYRWLARRELLVRHCGSFGLGERYLRVAVRSADENARLLAALAEAVTATAP